MYSPCSSSTYLALAGGGGVRVVRVTAARVARSEDFRIFLREEGRTLCCSLVSQFLLLSAVAIVLLLG